MSLRALAIVPDDLNPLGDVVPLVITMPWIVVMCLGLGAFPLWPPGHLRMVVVHWSIVPRSIIHLGLGLRLLKTLRMMVHCRVRVLHDLTARLSALTLGTIVGRSEV